MSNVRRETINEINRLTIIFTTVFLELGRVNNLKTILNSTNFSALNKRKARSERSVLLDVYPPPRLAARQD